MREELSEREVEILRLVATGASNKEIAARLDITANTVKVHLRNVFSKLEVRSRTEATVVALEMGLVSAPAPAEVGAAAEPTPVESVPPVLWWQKAALVVALVVALAIAAWPARFSGRVVYTGPDPLRENVGSGAVSGDGEEVGRWAELAQMPTGRHRFAAAVVGSLIVAAGGDTAAGITGSVEVYDAATNTWRLGADKPTPVSNVAAVAVGGRVYVPGGLQPDGTATSVLEVYDPKDDSWSTGPSLPMPLCAYGLATDGESIYLLGGWDGQRNRSGVYALDGGADAWRLLPSLPQAVVHPAATWAGGKLYVIGGYNGRQVLNDAFSLSTQDQSPGEWERLPNLAERRAGAGAAFVGDSLYVVGGGWNGPTAFCERLTLGSDRWEPWEMPITGAWRNMAVVADDTTLYALGGWNQGIRAELYRYQAVYRVLLPITG